MDLTDSGSAEKTGFPDFRPAKETDIDAVNDLYGIVKGRPFCVWDSEYPGLQEIKQDIAADDLFVMVCSGRIIGAISIEPENETDDLECWSSKRKAGEFARVVIHPDFQGRHLARVLVENLLKVMKRRGYENVHISVALDNIPAQKLYRGLGFKTVDRRELWGHMYYLCELKL